MSFQQLLCAFRLSNVPCLHRQLCSILIFLSLCMSVSAGAKCFNIPKGLSIAGAEYSRFRNVDHRSCALECRDDPSCLAYEWISTEETCYLKSRSLSGTLTAKEETIIGFCLDENDMIRDRFRDHVIEGPEVSRKENVDGDDCRDYCISQKEAVIYSWTPNDKENDEDYIGTCTCLESIRGMQLSFNSFSGILPPKTHRRREKFRI